MKQQQETHQYWTETTIVFNNSAQQSVQKEFLWVFFLSLLIFRDVFTVLTIAAINFHDFRQFYGDIFFTIHTLQSQYMYIKKEFHFHD